MKKILIISCIVLFVSSCRNKNSEHDEIVEKAAENTESSLPIKRMSNTENILDGIYSELIKKDSELQKLDSKVNSLQKDQRIIKDLYSDIIQNTDDYYRIAGIEAKGIQDSILKNEILALVNNSSENFNTKKVKFEEMMKQLNLNYHKIYSFYNSVKIRRTLPEIEKYQKAHPLKTDSLESLINKQNQLLDELKNMK